MSNTADARKESTTPTTRKIVCFSDFDGTIFMQDSGHVLVDALGCGAENRAKYEHEIKTGARSFVEVSEDMWGSLQIPFSDGFEIMQNQLDLDPGFQEFHQFCVAHNIDFNVISAGLKPVLAQVLKQFLGPEEASQIGIVANDADIREEGGQWKPIWLHDTPLGHDKARSIQEGRALAEKYALDNEIPLIIFIGDGVSDLPAAREADVLFARKGLRLEEYCKENQIPYIPFEDFSQIKREFQKIMKEDDEKTGGQGVPARFNPRANMWRRISSKQAVPQFVAATPKEEKMMLWPESFSELQAEKVKDKAAF